MPYPNERSSHIAVRRIAESPRISELLGAMQIRQVEARDDAPAPTLVHVDDLPKSDWQPRFIIAVDGSFKTIPVQNGYPGAEVAYITVASVLQNLERMRELDRERPVLPQKFRETQDSEALDWVLPGHNVASADDLDAKVAFRRGLYDLLNSQRMVPEGGETMLETYEALLQHKPANQRQQRCPLGEACPLDDSVYQPNPGIHTCTCKDKHAWYSTDALRIHERMQPFGGSNDRIYSEVMQVLERLWIVHILRTMSQQRWLSSLKRIAIVIDGPLAVFGQPAWISQAIVEEIRRLNREIRGVTGMDLLLLGIEKTGEFVSHFEQLDETDQGGRGKFPTQTALLLTDQYIKRNIYLSDSDKPYGTGTYFGRKLMYKTRTGQRIVATLPYVRKEDQNWDDAYPEQYPRLTDALALMDSLVSSRYVNALDPIVIAHAEATLPSKIGNKVLERLARDQTKVSQNQ